MLDRLLNVPYSCRKGTCASQASYTDRAEKRLRMSRNCSEKLGDTRGFCYSFAIELLLRGQFSASVLA